MTIILQHVESFPTARARSLPQGVRPSRFHMQPSFFTAPGLRLGAIPLSAGFFPTLASFFFLVTLRISARETTLFGLGAGANLLLKACP
jgi:hypothetical protein